MVNLLHEADAHPFEGWDFSWLGERMVVELLPWDFSKIVVEHARGSPDMLDMGTGGGEWLRGLDYRPSFTVATEGWAPNVPIASERLKPHQIPVVWVEGAPDNVDQVPADSIGCLPFRDGSFHLVINRHESFVPSEVARILARGGTFVTQQVGDGFNSDFYRLLGEPPPSPSKPEWTLKFAAAQVKDAGLVEIAGGEGLSTIRFADVGAFAWYTKHLPWIFPGFEIAKYKETLRQLHESGAVLEVKQPHFWIAARKQTSIQAFANPWAPSNPEGMGRSRVRSGAPAS